LEWVVVCPRFTLSCSAGCVANRLDRLATLRESAPPNNCDSHVTTSSANDEPGAWSKRLVRLILNASTASRALLLAGLFAIGINAITLLATRPLPAGGWEVRFMHLAYDAGQHFAITVVAIAIHATLKLLKPRRPFVEYAVVGALLWVTLSLVLWSDLAGFAQSLTRA